MERKIGYKLGYQIRICNGFYEVSYGKRVVYYGKCRRGSTIQEIVEKTILQQAEYIGT